MHPWLAKARVLQQCPALQNLPRARRLPLALVAALPRPEQRHLLHLHPFPPP